MSLQVWLPLNGSLNNRGLLDLKIGKQSNLAYSAGGKIGKCLEFNGNPNRILSFSNVPKLKNNFTWACWVKQTSRTSTSGDTSQFVLSDGRDFARIGFNIRLNNGYFAVSYGNSTSDTAAGVSGGGQVQLLDLNTWYHLCATVDNSKVKCYVNGTLIKTFDLVDIGFHPTDEHSYFTIGKMAFSHGSTTNYFPFSGLINDVRVYDHCLSPREVKEISKGLVLHYPLKSFGKNLLKMNDWTSPPTNFGYTNCSLSMVNGAIRMTITDATSSTHCYLREMKSRCGMISGKTYTASMLIRASKNLSRPSNLWVECWQTSGIRKNNVNITTKWTKQEVTFIYNPDATYQAWYLLFPGVCTGASNGDYIEFKNLKVELGSNSSEWIPDSIGSAIEYDCSGYGNDGAIVGSIIASVDTPRYNYSYTMFENTSYITTPVMDFSGMADSYSFSWWSKIPNMLNKMPWGFVNGNRLNLYTVSSNSNFCWNTADGGGNPFGVIFTDYNEAWHHYCVTGDGAVSTLYIDGIARGNAKTYKSLTGTQIILSGWSTGTSYKWANGSLSDFRIYATPLSEKDVKELYDTPIAISNNGILMTQGELIE